MNSLLLLTAILSGPDARPDVPLVEASAVYRAYIFNDALVDAELQDRVVEFRGHFVSIKRSRPTAVPAPVPVGTVPPYDLPSGPALPPTVPAGSPNSPAKVLGYDMIMAVSIPLHGNTSQEGHIRCRFPASARDKLAKLSDPKAVVILRGRCRGLTAANQQYQDGFQTFTGQLLEFTDCELVEVAEKPKASGGSDFK